MPLGKGAVITTMKYTLVLVLILGVATAQPNPPAAAAKTTPKTEDKKAAALLIPAGAVEVEPNLYKHTDKAGKVSYYRKTIFGVTRAPAPEKAAPVVGIQAFDQGDSVKFVRPGPFGLYTWVRKKTELNEDEKAAFDKLGTQGALPQSASSNKDH